MKITSATITPSNLQTGHWQAQVHATFEDSTQATVLEYYDDELTFHPEDFIGLTREGVRELFRRRDIAYLRS